MNLSAYLGIGLLLALLAAGAGWKHAIAVQEAFDVFKGTQEALAKRQAEDNAKEKVKHETDIKLAVSDRDVALAKLRERQRSSSSRVSVTPRPTEGTDKLCFARAQFDGALQQFLANAQGLAGEGDAAIIDNHVWIEAWPK